MLQLSRAIPYLATGNWKRAVSETTRRSATIASMTPAPMAGPLTAAMTGMSAASMLLIECCQASANLSGSGAPLDRSAPAQNEVPCPVMTMTRAVSAALRTSSAKASANS
ncbi:Uncharacterised protein [Mycobacteroides abscessus subsp. massiliense]|nr:Uncharacterised protein [Mycobacteroides abscessus subsp. massiliense]